MWHISGKIFDFYIISRDYTSNSHVFFCKAMFLFPQSFFHRIFSHPPVPLVPPRRCRFRLARESSQQLKKALAETEAAHFVGDTQGAKFD